MYDYLVSKDYSFEAAAAARSSTTVVLPDYWERIGI
jgi:hypothetical protein